MGRLFALSHGREQTFAGVFRMAGHESYQEVSRDIVNHAYDIREIHAVREILSVRIDILPQEGYVLIPGLDEFTGFSDYILRPAAALAAADVGDYAV